VPLKGLSTAFKTLTIISWPGREGKDLSSSLPWFPLIGIVLGTLLFLVARGWMLLPFSQWPAGGAFVILSLEIWFTRGLHLDGLADWADSLGGMLSKEKRLEIMKDSNVGAFGVLALILMLLAKWLVFERFISSGSVIWIIIVPVISRSMMVELMTTLPYARTGNGMGRDFVKGASLRHRCISYLLCIVFCVPFGPIGLGLMAFALIETRIYRNRCKKGFGGITGDLLGTGNEITELILFLICAIPGRDILLYTGWGWMFS
jgi:adenosylcobinamide-GDP ribazoletransferase